ncbi:MAG: CBS domain-containing protein [Candidatus Micrarchaeota archaeon]|nr:CBS domain-containing protein [Candidatus Micrarchaeota archaeon]
MNLPLPSELKSARKQAGLTQVQLASVSGVSQSVIAKVESGAVDPAYSTVQKLFAALEKSAPSVKLVRDVMHRSVVTIAPSDSVVVASRKMKKLGVSQLPVVSNGKLVGLLSEDDVMRGVEKAIVISGGGAKTKVARIMSPSPPVLSSSVPASALPSILRHSAIVCVVDGNKLVGVVTRADLLTAF